MEPYWLRWLDRSLRYDAASDSGAGTTANGGGNPGSQGANQPILEEMARRFLQNQGGGNGVDAIAKLLDENHSYRETIRTLKADLDKAKKAAAPEGALVLTGDAAAKIKALGDKPEEEIVKRLARLEEVEGQLKGFEVAKRVQEVARVANLNPTVLEKHLSNLDYVLEDVNQDGKTVKKAFVTTAVNGVTTKTEVVEFLKANHAELMPALQVTTQQQNGVQTQQQTQGWLPQQATTQQQNGGGDAVDAWLKQETARRAGTTQQQTAATT